MRKRVRDIAWGVLAVVLASLAVALITGCGNSSTNGREQSLRQAVADAEEYYQHRGDYQGFVAWAEKKTPGIVWGSEKEGVLAKEAGPESVKLSASEKSGKVYCAVIGGEVEGVQYRATHVGYDVVANAAENCLEHAKNEKL